MSYARTSINFVRRAFRYASAVQGCPRGRAPLPPLSCSRAVAAGTEPPPRRDARSARAGRRSRACSTWPASGDRGCGSESCAPPRSARRSVGIGCSVGACSSVGSVRTWCICVSSLRPLDLSVSRRFRSAESRSSSALCSSVSRSGAFAHISSVTVSLMSSRRLWHAANAVCASTGVLFFSHRAWTSQRTGDGGGGRRVTETPRQRAQAAGARARRGRGCIGAGQRSAWRSGLRRAAWRWRPWARFAGHSP